MLAVLTASLAVAAAGKTKYSLERFSPVESAETIPALDFFRPPMFRDPKLNDDGSRMAAVITDTIDRQDLLVYHFASSKVGTVHGSRQTDVADFDWLDDDRLLFSITSDKLFSAGLYVADARDQLKSYMIDRDNVAVMVARPEQNRMRPIVWIKQCAYDGGNEGRLVQVNAEKGGWDPFGPWIYVDEGSINYGTVARVQLSYPKAGPGDVLAYAGDAHGNLALAFTTENGVESVSRFESEQWIRCPIDLDEIEVLGAGANPRELVVLGPRQEGRPRAIQRMDAVTGSLGAVLWQDSRYDPSNCLLYRHPVSKELVGIRFDRGMRETVWLDPQYKKVQKAVERLMPGMVVEIFGSERDERRFFVSAMSDRSPVTYYSVDVETNQLGLIKC